MRGEQINYPNNLRTWLAVLLVIEPAKEKGHFSSWMFLFTELEQAFQTIGRTDQNCQREAITTVDGQWILLMADLIIVTCDLWVSGPMYLLGTFSTVCQCRYIVCPRLDCEIRQPVQDILYPCQCFRPLIPDYPFWTAAYWIVQGYYLDEDDGLFVTFMIRCGINNASDHPSRPVSSSMKWENDRRLNAC